MSFMLIVYHSCTSKTTSLIKTIKGARPFPTLRLEEGDCAPIFVQKENHHFVVKSLTLYFYSLNNISSILFPSILKSYYLYYSISLYHVKIFH